MKKILLLASLLLCIASMNIYAQNPSAIADFESNTQGILIPRMTQAERTAISMPANGLLVYQTDSTAGFYFNYGDSLTPAWKLLGEDNDSDPTNEIELPAGGTSGQILSTNGFNPLWKDLKVDEIQDFDGDTKIKAVNNASDYIRFDINGNNVINLSKNYRSLRFNLTSVSSTFDNLYIGYRTGINDDSTANTIGIGNYALENNKGTFSQSTGHVAIGPYALNSIGLGNATARYNIAVGFNAGRNLESGSDNSFFGLGAGGELAEGNYNVCVGSNAGLGLTSSSYTNTIVGSNFRTLPLPSYSQSGAVKIGFNAGRNDSTSQVLHIANNSTESLIYGEFDNRFLRLNGEVNIDSAYSLPTSDGSAGQVMTTDGAGMTSWSTLTNNEIIDSDGDTKIEAINSVLPDSDYIRFDVGGNHAVDIVESTSSLKMSLSDINDNIYLGKMSGNQHDAKAYCIGIGGRALESNTGDISNSQGHVALGYLALRDLTSGYSNTAIGTSSAVNLMDGTGNTFLGRWSGRNLQAGSNNIFIGAYAGIGLSSYSYGNTIIGFNSGYISPPVFSQQYAVKIGFDAGVNDSTDFVLHIANNDTNSLIYGEFDNKRVGINGDLGVRTQSPEADLHIVGESGATHVEVMVAPAATSNDTSSILMAEDNDGSFGVMMRYDGDDNKLKFFGKFNSEIYGPHLEIERGTSTTTQVGVGSAFPGYEFNVEGDMRVSDYTQLGSDAPKIKMKKLTGTTAPTEGGTSYVAHGLNVSKILSFSVLVTDGGFLITPHDISPFNFTAYATSTDIAVENISGESGNILSESFTVLITYEE